MLFNAKGNSNKLNLKGKLAFAMGITSTMPILGILLGSRYITLFTISFILYFLALALSVTSMRKLSFGVTSIKQTYLLFLLWPILSYIVGLIYMPDRWHSSMTSYLIKVLEYLALTLLLYINREKEDASTFSKGLIIGIAANAVWSIIEAISYYFFRNSLNDILFGRFLNLNREVLLRNKYGGIRVSGLNYDPAHLGGILPILLFYALMKRNVYLIILSVLSLAFSQSTTALVGCAVAFALYLFMKKKKETKSRRGFSKKSLIGIPSSLAIVIVAAIAMSSNGNVLRFISSISENVSGYVSRIMTVYVQSDTVEPREVYYTQAFDRLLDRGSIVALTGSGLGTSMYPYRIFTGLFPSGSENAVTEIETNYIAYLFDLGVVGLFFYISFLIKGFRGYYKKIKLKFDPTLMVYLGTFVSVLCVSALYHYIFTAYQMIAFSFAVVYLEQYRR